ncbi:MAG: rhomboid family intramembrane serine protease [Haloplanus sp.]
MLGDPLGVLQRLVFLLAVLVAVAVVVAVDRPGGRWGARLRTRFLAGVPWGTLVTVALVLGVYLFVQGGLHHWNAPVTIPFRAWSYYYPLGMVTAAFAHAGPAHIVGNLVGTVVLAPLAEYAWGHFPRERGVQTFTSPLTNPYVRAFVVVPAAAVAVGLFTAVFALGPVIGFSGVVFAFAGFALVRYPIAAVVAVSAGNALRTVYEALRQPVLTASGHAVYSTPWWADVAIQGHAIGLLSGVLLGVWLSRARETERPSAVRIAVGVFLFAAVESLWAVYWYRGAETYVLYRGVGVALVALLTAVTVTAVAASDRPLLSLPDAPTDALRTVPRWQVGATILLLCTAALAGPAVPVNLTRAAGGDLPGTPVRVHDYEVTYAENVPNGMVSTVDVSAFGETTQVNTSGVIVRSRRRGIWLTAVSKGRLDFDGGAVVRLGGLGWRDAVRVRRRGWVAVGGGATYRVRLLYRDRNVTAFTAPPARAEPVVAGRNVSIETTPTDFRLNVTRGNRSVTGPIPANNESVTVGGLQFVTVDDKLFARSGETRVRVAEKETYH